MSNRKGTPSRPVALVTGSMGSLGREIAGQLAQAGYDLILQGRRRSPALGALAAEWSRTGIRVGVLTADLSQTGRLGALARQAVGFWGRIDLLVNSASEFSPTPSGGRPLDWDRMFRVNAAAPYFLSRALGKTLASSRGSIVNLVDTYADHPVLPDHPAYLASKAALAALTRVLARELAPAVRVNGVSPGAVTFPASYSRARRKTIADKTLLKRAGTPADIAGAVLYLAGADYMTGEILRVDGGRFI